MPLPSHRGIACSDPRGQTLSRCSIDLHGFHERRDLALPLHVGNGRERGEVSYSLLKPYLVEHQTLHAASPKLFEHLDFALEGLPEKDRGAFEPILGQIEVCDATVD